MINGERAFVGAVRKYCASHGIEVELRAQGWLIVMTRGSKRRFAFGYDLGLNSAVAHRIANDKAATADVLEICGIPCVPHTAFLSPRMYKYITPAGAWTAMLDLLQQNPEGIVVKPNEGTGGISVFKVRTEPELEVAANEIFSSERSLAISPYVDIEDEVRVILIDYRPIVVFSKNRLSVIGDGTRSVLELAIATIPAERLSKVLSGLSGEISKASLDEVPPAGRRHALNWRHNLGAGAQAVVLAHDEARAAACIAIAVAAARSIEMRFGSIDVVRVNGRWKVLEINSGVMMEALNQSHPELVDAAYAAALDTIFGSNAGQ
ncbi:RimK-like protein [Bradyrhizobium sp. KBS0727]|uniref:ATP-grasp domain-containing protein n=1 Tax=unclassified Bradyrhizobium TaxID=2631580 RepID=UPI00110F6013|nr:MULTISPECIES: RimK-like protein [unclassified Bradyrhizobium]QDW41516.1 RimK-like protein [Bradyrhizobium sp. KBS0725]QDW48122.1 RimK-like protein [Bradyrhizobium sp. KBS0727]